MSTGYSRMMSRSISSDLFTVCSMWTILIVAGLPATCKGNFEDPPNKSCEKNLARYYQGLLSVYRLRLCTMCIFWSVLEIENGTEEDI